jgi:hypothetical protein
MIWRSLALPTASHGDPPLSLLPNPTLQGTLAQLDSPNPVFYLNFPAGRLKFNGTLLFPANKYMVLRLGGGPGGAALAEDVFENIVSRRPWGSVGKGGGGLLLIQTMALWCMRCFAVCAGVAAVYVGTPSSIGGGPGGAALAEDVFGSIVSSQNRFVTSVETRSVCGRGATVVGRRGCRMGTRSV